MGVSGQQGAGVPGYQSVGEPGYQGTRLPGCGGTRVLEYQDNRVPEYQSTRVPGYQGNRVGSHLCHGGAADPSKQLAHQVRDHHVQLQTPAEVDGQSERRVEVGTA